MIDQHRKRLRELTYAPEADCIGRLLASLGADAATSGLVSAEAARLIDTLRSEHEPGLMEGFLLEYGLNTDEGIALMCLAEAYLRVPDSETLDALIADKIGDSDWARHLGHAQSALVNASTWALMLTGQVFRTIPAQTDDLARITRSMVRRLGEPVVRRGVAEVMKILGSQFVLGRSIDEALAEGTESVKEAAAAGTLGTDLFSFDMLGEAARTTADANRYFLSYSDAISEIAKTAVASNPHDNSGISVKLSALHPRYESTKRERVMNELVPRITALAQHAKAANIAMAVDAEEANRLDLSLDVIEAVLTEPDLANWPGLGVVVQAYSKRAPAALDWLWALTESLDRRISVRLVKGAYWDSEIKQAQVMGLPGYPVFTRKDATDVSYLACAKQLLGMQERIYPQFATHNAHTALVIEKMAGTDANYEFQRLHGMGEALHETLRATDGRRRRVYAPVGVHKDLLAYLVRRLLENGANSSFVNQIMNKAVNSRAIAADPVAKVTAASYRPHPRIPLPAAIYAEGRTSAKGWDVNDPSSWAPLSTQAQLFVNQQWNGSDGADGARDVINPANHADTVGTVKDSTAAECKTAVARACEGFQTWSSRTPNERALCLERAAELYEANAAELMALAVREAGKTWTDAIAELREAVDFLRYYALRCRELPEENQPIGVIVCISPWNFPLAIFTGQLSGALAAGNSVVAKPAEQTPLLAERAVVLLHEAGVDNTALILARGDGAVGAALTADPAIAGVCFTGSNDTAQLIDMNMAMHGNPCAGLVAETGGINAMIVDSTALLEQAVKDIVTSAFQSAGQRCSAARVVYVQRDIAKDLCKMLAGAAKELKVGDPWCVDTDIGPVIDEAARLAIQTHCDRLDAAGRTLFIAPLNKDCATGTFVAPSAFRLDSIDELRREIFGPVLHVIEFDASALDAVVDEINATGYGLTFSIHSRLDSRVDAICAKVKAGNLYVNRNQIGAVVGVQPFGGERLSGTGPKAGGPLYISRFTTGPVATEVVPGSQLLQGPTGEKNTYIAQPKRKVLCLGPSEQDIERQTALVSACGSEGIVGQVGSEDLEQLIADHEIDIALYDGKERRSVRRQLAELTGPRVQLSDSQIVPARLVSERLISEDTTASGGNASLLADVS